MKNKKIVLFTTLLLGVIFVLVANFYEKSVDTKTEQLAATNSAGAPFVRDHSPSFGENQNKVIITEFLDPECESCRAFHPAIKEVFNDYKKETKLVYRYLANHQNSRYAVKVLESARLQDKYNETLEVMFKYQPQWAAHNSPKPELLWTFLPEAGLDMTKLRADFEKIDVDTMLQLDRADAVQLGVTGTPTFYVNGKILKEYSIKALYDLVESEIYK